MSETVPTADPGATPEARSATAEGRARRARAQGAKSPQLHAALAALDPQLATWADEFIFGEVWGRPGLAHEDRMLVAITALAATGQATQLRNYLFGALESGVEPARIHEALVMLVVYCGFPTALGALDTWRDVVRSAERRGIIDRTDHAGS